MGLTKCSLCFTPLLHISRSLSILSLYSSRGNNRTLLLNEKRRRRRESHNAGTVNMPFVVIVFLMKLCRQLVLIRVILSN